MRTNCNQKGTAKKRWGNRLISGLFSSIENFRSDCSQSTPTSLESHCINNCVRCLISESRATSVCGENVAESTVPWLEDNANALRCRWVRPREGTFFALASTDVKRSAFAYSCSHGMVPLESGPWFNLTSLFSSHLETSKCATDETNSRLCSTLAPLRMKSTVAQTNKVFRVKLIALSEPQ